MASRNPHSGDPRPGPSRGSRLPPVAIPVEAERRIARCRFPSFEDRTVKKPENRLSGDVRFKPAQCRKRYPGRMYEERNDERLIREEGLEKYLERVDMDEMRREKKETSESPSDADQEAYNRLIAIPLFEEIKEEKEEEEMDIEIKMELMDENEQPVEIALNEVKEESIEVTEIIQWVMENTLIESLVEKENDLSGSESVKGEEEELKGGVDEVEMEEPIHYQRHNHSLSGRQPMQRSRTSESATPAVMRNYKVMFDHTYMTHLQTKDFVRRSNGKCPEKYKQFDYPTSPKDPRIKFRRVDQPKNLIVPNLLVDDQYTGIPPKREVTISNLNDNANKEFLLKMTRNRKFEPQEVQVFYHPTTKKHLKMALILFSQSKDAKAFVDASNGMSVMGEPISCRLDPFAAELNAAYTSLTNAPLPPLQYLSGMSEHELSLRREKITGSNVDPSPPVEAAPPIASKNEEELNRSLSPMDTSNSPIHYEPVLPPPPIMPPLQQEQAYYEDADASTSKIPSPPPPYSELPPMNHSMIPEEERRRSTSRKRSPQPEGRAKSNKRRHASTSSSSSSSSGENDSKESRRRSDGGVKKKKREEYLKVKRYVSSERDSNGDKRILKEVKTVTYKRRTERIANEKSPDSFDEEMQRRKRESLGSNKSNKSRGRDEMEGWSSPSSDSDGGRSRRKRAKDRAESHSKEDDEKRPPPPTDPVSSTPLSFCSTPSTSITPSRRRGFDSAPVFDPTQPPPVCVPPVGVVVLPGPSLAPPSLIPMPPIPPMMAPPMPPPLPGGFIPPPEFFGFASNPPMLHAVSAHAAGMTPLPPGLPPPPPSPMSSISGYGGTPGYGNTPMNPFNSPARPVKMPLHPEVQSAAAAVCGLSAAVSSPLLTSSGMVRASSSLSLREGGGRTPMEIHRAMATPPSEGCHTPIASTTAEKKEKVNLDDRLSELFPQFVPKKEKKVEETRETREMKHAASAPSISTMEAEHRMMEDDDMDIVDDEDMDVESPEEAREETKMMERGGGGGGGGGRMEEEKRQADERAERKKKEDQAASLTKMTLDKLVNDLQQQITRDLQKQLEKTALMVVDEWEKRQRNDEEEMKKNMIRDLLAARTAQTHKPDQTEQILLDTLASPDNPKNGVKKMMFNANSFKIIKKTNPEPVYSRDGTPASDSRAPSRAKSRSASRFSSRSSSSSSSSSSSNSDDDTVEDGVRKAVRRRPNMRNIDSSQESSLASSSDNESDTEDELEVVGANEEDFEQIKKELKDEEGASPSSSLYSPSPSAASSPCVAASSDQVVKTEEEEDEGAQMPSTSRGAAAGAAAPPLTAAELAAELLRQQPSMRPGEGGYDPIRYDHPYVRQLGLPYPANRTFVPPAVQRVKGMANAGSARVSPFIPSPLVGAVSAAAASTVQQAKPIMKRKIIDGRDKLSHEIVNLLPPPVVSRGPKKNFKKRTDDEERRVRDSFKSGVDGEDDGYLKRMLEELQRNGARPFGVDKEVEFESFLRAYTPIELTKPTRLGRTDLYYDDEDLAGLVPHSTGSARTEGFYRLTNKQKIRILRRPEAFQDRTEINERDEVVTRHQLHAQKEQRSMNRRLLTMADSNPNSDFFKVNQLKYRKKMIKFARSRIHGWGLYALEPIAPDDMIVEYIGQKIRPIVAEEREKQYERRGIGSSYLFRIDEDEVIDATRQGNFARFINHSCQPNCYAKVVTVDGDKRIVIYSKTLIQKGDEITYDYKFPVEEDKIECLCGAPSCRGTLN